LTTGQLVPHEHREEAGQRGGHAGLAAAAADDAPQLTHALERQNATTGNGGEDLALRVSERQCKGSLEHSEPGRPGADVAQLGAEQALVAQDLIDRERRHGCWCSRMMSFSVRPVSRNWRLSPSRWKQRPSRSVSVPYTSRSISLPAAASPSRRSHAIAIVVARRASWRCPSLNPSGPDKSLMI